MNKQQPIKVDLSKIPNMKCYCGADVFAKVFNLKYISAILCGDPQGGTAVVFMYQCTLCRQLYPKATTADEVNKIYQKLHSDQKAYVDDLKLKVKAQKDALSDIVDQKMATK
jgi:hypothetical protein